MNMFNVCGGTLEAKVWALDSFSFRLPESQSKSRSGASNFISLSLFATGIFIVMATFMSFTSFVSISVHF